MRNLAVKNLLLLLLSIVFSAGLMFAFTELPRLIDQLMQSRIGFPGFDHGLGTENALWTDLYIHTYRLRIIGYTCLGLVALLIIIGFTTRKTGWAWAGALIVFLPVFGQFAISMFFLAGLGILRTGWLPLLDVSDQILNLGQVAFLPYRILMWFFGLFGWYAREFLEWFFMGAGAFLFTWGVMSWFNVRFSGHSVARSRIYRISRHPQYLGWILWSYGYVIFSSGINNMKKSWGFSGSLSWLIMTMIIIGICMLEEMKMEEDYGEQYREYRAKTPFLFPLPSRLVWLLKTPMRWIIRKDRPVRKREVAWTVGIYTLIFMSLSLFWVDFGRKEAKALTEQEVSANIDTLVSIIERTGSRREIGAYYQRLGELGNPSLKPLLHFLQDEWEVNREFAAIELGKLGHLEAFPYLVKALEDPVGRVRNQAADALGNLGNHAAVPVLVACLDRDTLQIARWKIYSNLGQLGSVEAWDIIVGGLDEEQWYYRTAALGALVSIDPDSSLYYIHRALEDEHFGVRRKAASLLIDRGKPESLPFLEAALDDPDFETRFFATQAIGKIKSPDRD